MDSKLDWSAHAKALKSKAKEQRGALTRIVTTTWGASLNSARKVYRHVIGPGLTYGSVIWHKPRDLGRKNHKSIENQLAVEQSRCLRVIAGAYRATPSPMVHNEAQVFSMGLVLDKATLRNVGRRAKSVQNTINKACDAIQQNLSRRGRRGRQRGQAIAQSTATASDLPEYTKLAVQQTREIAPDDRVWIDTWAKDKWGEEWAAYVKSKREDKYPALAALEKRKHLALHKTLTKAESSLLTQLRTGRISLEKFLYKRKVSCIDSPLCDCGKEEQDVQHVLNCA